MKTTKILFLVCAILLSSGCTSTRVYLIENYKPGYLGIYKKSKDGTKCFSYNANFIKAIEEIASKYGKSDYSVCTTDKAIIVRARNRRNTQVSKFLKEILIEKKTRKKTETTQIIQSSNNNPSQRDSVTPTPTKKNSKARSN